MSVLSLAARERPFEQARPSQFLGWPLPDTVWSLLEKRGHSTFTSEPYLRLWERLGPRTEAWIPDGGSAGSMPVLFERRGRTAVVLNDVVGLRSTDLDHFADALFTLDRRIGAIAMNGIRIEGDSSRHLLLATQNSEDYVLDLPATPEAWLASLSALAREKVRYHHRRALRRAPGLRFVTHDAPEIPEATLRAVIAMNRARMQVKGKRFGMDEAEERRLVALLRERGRVAALEIDGTLCAGMLCTVAGGDLYMHVIAHDPRRDDLRLGLVCCKLAIEDAIGRGLQRFHFLWGHYDYKTRLGAQPLPLQRALLLRGPLQALAHPRLVGEQAAQRLRSRLRAWKRRAASRRH